MTKYHINDKGKPAVCKATKGNCPFGDADSHYNSKEEAQMEANKINEAKYSLLPGAKNKGKASKKKLTKKATKKDNAYINNRKKFLLNETSSPTYIEKCRSSTKMEKYDFYKKEREQETHHFDHERKFRRDKLESIYGDGETVGFYEVDHQVKGTKYKKQVVEIKSTGQLIIYDKYKGHKITSFMAHRARIETMIILAGEIPDQDFMRNVTINHTNDLKRQAIDRKQEIA